MTCMTTTRGDWTLVPGGEVREYLGFPGSAVMYRVALNGTALALRAQYRALYRIARMIARQRALGPVSAVGVAEALACEDKLRLVFVPGQALD